jgi:hypothetical protein
VKRLPFIAPLGQTICDDEEGLGIYTHAGVAADHFDVFYLLVTAVS